MTIIINMTIMIIITINITIIIIITIMIIIITIVINITIIVTLLCNSACLKNITSTRINHHQKLIDREVFRDHHYCYLNIIFNIHNNRTYCVTFLLCDPGWCVLKSGVQNKWDENTHTHTHRINASGIE